MTTTQEAAPEEVARALGAVGLDGLLLARDQAERLLEDDGVTYHRRGPDGAVEHRWELDPVPYVVGEAQWAVLERGLAQRAILLDRLLADLYGPRDTLARGLLPPEVVLAHDGFVRACDGIALPGARQLFLSAVDLACGTDGGWTALGDRTQAPSGAGYAMENRRVVSRVLPSIYREVGLQRLSPFFHAMRVALQQVAPTTADEPRVVILTPGSRSETAFDQAFLASLLGYPLVEGSDLTVQDGRVWLRALGRLEPVDVILRRVDSGFCDPLELRPDSQLGVPGLVTACRLGTVSVVNTLGSGVLENPGLLPFLPALSEALLDESLQLPSVRTWWCGDPAARRHVLARMESLVLRPLSRSEGRSVFGADLSAAQRDDVARRIEARPYSWVAQDALAVAAADTVTDRGLQPRRAVLRSFAVAYDGSYRVMAGGLTRVADSVDQRYVSHQVGAVAKDAWVLSSQTRPVPAVWIHDGPLVAAVRPTATLPPRVVEDLFWFGRYAERSEDLTRLLRTVADRASDFQLGDDADGVASLQVLLAATTDVSTTYPGFVGDGGAGRLADPHRELYELLVDAARPGTVAHSLGSLAAAAHAVRDQLSADTWLVLGGIDRVLDRLRAGPGDHGAAVSAAQARILEGLLAVSGLVGENMVRDPGWRLLDAGRRVERGLQLLALLRATVAVAHPPAVESLLVESVLAASESIITYRRRYRDKAQVTTVLDLLLVDGDNPRSLLYQLDRLREDLAAVTTAGGSPRPGHQLEQLAVRLQRVDLAAATRAERGPDGVLAQELALLHRELADLAAAIEATMFGHLAGPQPL